MNAELLSVLGDDLMVANCARVSMAKHHETFDSDSDARLIHYLARENHWTPFAHPQAQFRLKAPIFVARQWFRHTVGTIRSEVSRRYVDEDPTFFAPKQWRSRPDGSIKQGSGKPLLDHEQVCCNGVLFNIYDNALSAYRALLKYDVAPEQARMVLPQTMYTQWIETASLYYWARLCRLRLDAHAQQEIRELAEDIAAALRQRFPVSWHALIEFGGQHD